MLTQQTAEDLLKAGRAGGRVIGIEEAAEIAENFRDGNPEAWDSVATTGRRIAAAIRALAAS